MLAQRIHNHFPLHLHHQNPQAVGQAAPQSGSQVVQQYLGALKTINGALTNQVSYEKACASYETIRSITETHFDFVVQNYSYFESEFVAFQQNVQQATGSDCALSGKFSELFVQTISIHLRVVTEHQYVMIPQNHEKVVCMLRCYREFIKTKCTDLSSGCSAHCSKCFHDICEVILNFKNKFSCQIESSPHVCHETISFVELMIQNFHSHLSAHHFHACIRLHISVWHHCSKEARIKIIEKLCCSEEKIRDLFEFVKTAIAAGTFFAIEELKCIMQSLFKFVTCSARHTIDFTCRIACAIMAELCKGLHCAYRLSVDTFRQCIGLIIKFTYDVIRATERLSEHAIQFICHVFKSLVDCCTQTRCHAICEKDVTYMIEFSTRFQYTHVSSLCEQYRKTCLASA